MRLSLIALLALLLCFAHAKPLDSSNEEGDKDSADISEPEKKDTTESTEEKDTSSDEENSDENSDEKKDEVEASPSEDEESSDDDSKSNENASETSSETPSEDSKPAEVEEDENPDEGSKKDEVPAKDSASTEETFEPASKREDVVDTKDNDESEDSDKEENASKRDGYGGSEGGHHGGDEGGHEGEHGHHEHDHHEHDHHHHDHGYEFYEEWGEHGGHEGEHHGHHEGGHHGEHGHHHGHHGGHHGGRDSVPTVAMFAPEATPAKKWWLVGDHWGGWGHSNWAHPHPHHEGGGWQWGHHGLHYGGHGGGHHKSHIPDCCKSVDPEVTKRCGCEDGGHYGTNHHGGYHFTDHGSGHDDHDHEIHGPWSFGYDNFGDDWGDWDHNHHNFEHLSHMEHLPHDDHGCGHGGGHGRDCVPNAAQPFSQFYPSLRLTAPVGLGYGNAGFGGAGYGGYGNAGFGGAGYGGYGGGYGGNNYGVYGSNRWPVRKFDNYRVCHKCHDLPHGGSRCLCKSVRHHPLYLPVVHRPAHVYIDCDTAVHKFPQNRCVARTDISLPESEATESGSAKQGVVYPYVGYGPWSAYPWWGDWWGGHGHHAWGEGKGCGHGGGGGGHGGGHGGGIVGGHGGVHGGGCGGGNHMGRQVGFSFGGHGGGGVGGGVGGVGGGHLQAYHCKDSVEKSGSNEGKTKRFCVPIGHHGGYGWPYWHGYPGVGTGLWGWGWPWIKNKVPGSKGARKEAGASDEKKESKKSSIPKEDQKKTKKQTIHVGYGYASGDNYRLGYGMGGMGGVAGFTGGHEGPADHAGSSGQFARSKIPRKSDTPVPETKKDVTGTKRDMGLSNGAQGTGSMLGHPVTHPGYTTMGFPGHGDSSIEAFKDHIPKTKKST